MVAFFILAAVDMDLAARAAGASFAHLPEVVLFTKAQDTLLWHWRELTPQIVGFIIIGIDGHIQLVLRQTQFLSQKRPSIGDGISFEIIAEGKVAQHFKKGMVSGGAAYGIQVIMLAAGAHAFLRGRSSVVISFFQAQEYILELVHPCIGKEQSGVIIGHQR